MCGGFSPCDLCFSPRKDAQKHHVYTAQGLYKQAHMLVLITTHMPMANDRMCEVNVLAMLIQIDEEEEQAERPFGPCAVNMANKCSNVTRTHIFVRGFCCALRTIWRTCENASHQRSNDIQPHQGAQMLGWEGWFLLHTLCELPKGEEETNSSAMCDQKRTHRCV